MKYCGYHLSVNPACALFVELMYVKFMSLLMIGSRLVACLIHGICTFDAVS